MKLLGNSRRMTFSWRQLAGDSGAEIAETAIVMPLVFLFLLAIFWFGRAYNVYSTITYAAREGALTAARTNCATCGNTLPTPANVAARVTSVLQASKLDPTPIAIYNVTPTPNFCAGFNQANSCGISGNVTVCRNVQLNSTNSNLPTCGALVSFQYPYQFYLPFTSLGAQLFNLPAAAEVPMEY